MQLRGAEGTQVGDAFRGKPVDPPRGQWLNIAMGRGGRPRTIRLGALIGDGYRLLSLVAFSVVALLMPRADGTSLGTGGPATPFPVTDLLLSTFGWISAWLLTGGACLAVGEFNRRRRLHDPAYPRSRVLWAVPGPEATALESERASIERAGWRLVVSDSLPGYVWVGPEYTQSGEALRVLVAGAGHIVGTHRMGTCKENSVTKGTCQTWDHENLYLVGGGSMPTLGTGRGSAWGSGFWAAESVGVGAGDAAVARPVGDVEHGDHPPVIDGAIADLEVGDGHDLGKNFGDRSPADA